MIKVQIENMAYNWSMWKNGVAPVYRSNYTSWRWAFLDHFPLNLRLKKQNLQMEFKYRLRRNEKVYIALSFPWTYTMDRAYYHKLEDKYINDPDLYFEKEVHVSDFRFSPSQCKAAECRWSRSRTKRKTQTRSSGSPK